MMTLKQQNGFTLVEIAVVLVIITLVFSVIMKTQSMIERSRVRNVVKHLDELQAASLTYLDRFSAIPGDDGSDHGGLITPATTNPNDGQIDNPAEYWQQLHDAGIIEGVGTDPMKTPWGTPYSALYNAAGFNDNAVCAYLPLEIAIEIDDDYDDGNSTTGAYRLATDNNGQPDTTSSDPQALGKHAWLCTKDIQKSLRNY